MKKIVTTTLLSLALVSPAAMALSAANQNALSHQLQRIVAQVQPDADSQLELGPFLVESLDLDYATPVGPEGVAIIRLVIAEVNKEYPGLFENVYLNSNMRLGQLVGQAEGKIRQYVAANEASGNPVDESEIVGYIGFVTSIVLEGYAAPQDPVAN